MAILTKNHGNWRLSYRENTHDLSMIEEIWNEHHYRKYFPVNQKGAVIDIGAHNGYFSMYAAANLAPGSVVYGFEPIKDNYEIFTKNLTENKCSNVVADNSAVGAQEGQLDIFVNAAHSGGHSVFKERVEVYKPAEAIPVEKVKCTTLQAILAKIEPAPLMCKIDTEGAEYDILSHTPPELIGKIPVYAVEFHEFGGHKVEELLSLFRQLNYKVEHEYTPSKKGIVFGMLWACR